MRWSALVLALLAPAMWSCASSGASSSGFGDPDIITREEIEESTAATAYDLVLNLRPQWLRTRGISTLAQAAGQEDIVVYMNNARLGFRDAMRQVPLGAVQYLQFFTAREATHRWGAGHLHGAILISTQRRWADLRCPLSRRNW
jgi:hypothetical protein